MMPRLAILLLCVLAGGCAAATVASEDTGPQPAFPAYKPPSAGEGRILLTAGQVGRLSRQGRCLGFAGFEGGFTTIIWPETARLARDLRGIFITDSLSGTRIRLGDYFQSGGGQLPEGAAARIAAELTEPVPPECAASIVTVNPGFKKGRRPR